MGLCTLIKKYPVFLLLAMLGMASCNAGRGFHLKSASPLSSDDAEQRQLAREFQKLEKKAARQATRPGRNKPGVAKNSPDPKIEKVVATARSYYGNGFVQGKDHLY